MNSAKIVSNAAKRFGGSLKRTDHKVILTLNDSISTQTVFFPTLDAARNFSMVAAALPEVTDFLVVSKQGAVTHPAQCVALMCVNA